jgi:putative ABC transport system permease protein
MKFVGLVLRNLWRSKLRTGLTIVSTAVALFLFVMLRTLVTSLDASVDVADASRLVVRRSTSLIFPLPLSYRERLAGVEGLSGITWMNWFGGINPADERGFFAQFAVDEDTFFDLYPELLLEPEELAAFKSERTACVVGTKLAKRYGWKPGDNVTLRGTIYPGEWTLTVRGIYRPKTPEVDTNTLYFHWKFLDERMRAAGQDGGEVGVYVVRLADVDQAAAMAQRIDALFANSSAESRTETEKAFQLGFVTMMGNVRGAVRILAAFVLSGFLLVGINTMLMAARERTREIAVLKTLGFPDGLILRLVLIESTLIALLGGLIGTLGAGFVLTGLANSGNSMFATFLVRRDTLVIGIGIAAAMGMLAGLLPAIGAARLRVVDALRQA